MALDDPVQQNHHNLQTQFTQRYKLNYNTTITQKITKIRFTNDG